MTVENDQLMTQATGQPKFPMYAEAENKDFLKVVDAQEGFLKDETGSGHVRTLKRLLDAIRTPFLSDPCVSC